MSTSKRAAEGKKQLPGSEGVKKKFPWATVSKVALVIEALVAVALVITLVVKVLGNTVPTRPVIDATACPSAANRACQTGALFTALGGQELCQYSDSAVGTACDSACHVDDTTTTCDSDHVCTNADPTTCLGYCAVTSGALFDTNSSDCFDKLVFKDFLTWNSPYRSADSNNWLYFTDYPAECWYDQGCTWFATILQLHGTTAPLMTTATRYVDSCLEPLNMTNSECIEALEITFTEAQSNTFFRNVNDALDAGDYSAVNYHAIGCVYHYACGVRNETYMTDPDLLLGDKRSIAADAPALASVQRRAVDLTLAHQDSIRAQWLPKVAAMHRRPPVASKN
jgi:hypothetical protein